MCLATETTTGRTGTCPALSIENSPETILFLLHVWDVHRGDSLSSREPSCCQVHGQNVSLRADQSLRTPPYLLAGIGFPTRKRANVHSLYEIFFNVRRETDGEPKRLQRQKFYVTTNEMGARFAWFLDLIGCLPRS